MAGSKPADPALLLTVVEDGPSPQPQPSVNSNMNSTTTTTTTLSSDLSLKANKELCEKAEWRRRDIDALRQMVVNELEQQPGLRPCLDDGFLLRFLRARKFDYERSLKLLLNYYAVRHTYKTDVFSDLLPSALDHILNENLIAFLDTAVDYYGRRILLFKASNWRNYSTTIDDILKDLLLSMELEISNEATQVNGIVAVVDAGGLSLAHMFQHIKTASVRKAFGCFQDCFPCRLKAVHFINESPILDGILTLTKPLMTEKFRQRLFFHGSNLLSLQQHIDCEALPADFGGSAPEFSAKLWNTRLKSAESNFQEAANYGYVDSAPIISGQADGSPLRTVLTTYKRLCIDGLNG